MFCTLEFSLRKFVGLIFLNYCFHCGNSNFKNNGTKHTIMEGKIVRGSPVDIERYPWSVLIFNSGAVCGGTILNKVTVLSAAHCFGHNTKVPDISVHVGSRYLYDQNAIIHTVNRVENHKDYNKETPFSCDISLVFLDDPITFNRKAQKADLIDNGKWMNKDEHGFTVVGWGMIKHNGPLSEHGLLMTTLKYIPTTECSVMHQLKLTDDMFCLYGDAEKDSCNGDSGGGVLWKGYLVGVVSHGDGCAGINKPSIYTNVWFFRNWIKNKIVGQYRYLKSKNVNVHRMHGDIVESIQCKSLLERIRLSPQGNSSVVDDKSHVLRDSDKHDGASIKIVKLERQMKTLQDNDDHGTVTATFIGKDDTK